MIIGLDLNSKYAYSLVYIKFFIKFLDPILELVTKVLVLLNVVFLNTSLNYLHDKYTPTPYLPFDTLKVKITVGLNFYKNPILDIVKDSK